MCRLESVLVTSYLHVFLAFTFLQISGSGDHYEKLISHPLTLALIRHKWNITRLFYFLFLTFYMTFVVMVTAYMVVAEAPYEL